VNPNSTGRKCSLDETRTEETQSCDMPECPIDCKVGPWSEWSPAGQQGGLYMRKRSRNVRPNNSTGKPCSKLQERTDEIIPKCGVSVEDD
jgi:hypothetical protein